MDWHLGIREVKATRKPHICNWCGETIETGSFAVRNTGVWDMEFASVYLHAECRDAMDDWFHGGDSGDTYYPKSMVRGHAEER